MVFRQAENTLTNLLHETILEVAQLNPDYPFIFTLEADDPDAEVESVTYKQFVADVARVAKAFQKIIPARKAGTEIQNVGMLAKSDYIFALQWMACQFNRWAVSVD